MTGYRNPIGLLQSGTPVASPGIDVHGAQRLGRDGGDIVTDFPESGHTRFPPDPNQTTHLRGYTRTITSVRSPPSSSQLRPSAMPCRRISKVSSPKRWMTCPPSHGTCRVPFRHGIASPRFGRSGKTPPPRNDDWAEHTSQARRCHGRHGRAIKFICTNIYEEKGPGRPWPGTRTRENHHGCQSTRS